MNAENTNLSFRIARKSDVFNLVELLADDKLGAKRELVSTPLHSSYMDAFNSIDTDTNNELTVVEQGGQLVGMLQLTFIPYMTHMGSWRCQIEGVRIAQAYRGKGFGTKFIDWAIARASTRKCSIVQLTSDKQRPQALRFYESLGFKPTHEGFKLILANK